MVLVDAKYYGHVLKTARRRLRLRTIEMAKMLKLSAVDLRRYERGVDVIPENVILRLIQAGMSLISLKKARQEIKETPRWGVFMHYVC